MAARISQIAAALILVGLTAFGVQHRSALQQHPAKASSANKPLQQQSKRYAQNQRAMELADAIAERNTLDRDWTRNAIGAAREIPQIQKLVMPVPNRGNKKNWAAYRTRFVEPVRIRAGVQFWDAHAADLQRAQETYGVPAEIIVGILGMETLYGQHTGKIRVMDALTTLAVDFPSAHPRAESRREYFVLELEQYLKEMHRTGADPMKPRGSYSGDMGLPQFMPSSWTRFGVDFDGNGGVDLWSAADAIGSVANYLKQHGWIAGLAVYYVVSPALAPDVLDAALSPGLAPDRRVEQLGSDLIVLSAGQSMPAPETPIALVALENLELPKTYVAATGNLRVITRYNPSRYYAMAVTDLGGAVADARAATAR